MLHTGFEHPANGVRTARKSSVWRLRSTCARRGALSIPSLLPPKAQEAHTGFEPVLPP
jgi:hypothetical protein